MSDKAEGDGRSPAGVFSMRRSFGYDPQWARKTRLAYVAVTTRDLFVEDPSSEWYNTYVRLDHEPQTVFEQEQQMKQDDPMHRLKIVIEHNTTPSPEAGKGSAILFHIWRRNGALPTAGCTSISDAAIESMMQWLDPAKRPLYVLLPTAKYKELASAWGLPA